MKNSPLSTSRRSAIQATDSTCKGCRANSRHHALGQSCAGPAAALRRRLCANRCRHRSLGGHSPQDQKQRHRRSGVQQQIGQVVPGRIQAKELAVEHVREHRQRIPLAHRPVGECPDDSRPGQASRDVRLVKDVSRNRRSSGRIPASVRTKNQPRRPAPGARKRPPPAKAVAHGSSRSGCGAGTIRFGRAVLDMMAVTGQSAGRKPLRRES